MLAGVSWENEVTGDVVQHQEGFTVQPGVQLRSLAWAFWLLEIKKLHANPHFPEDSDQVLAQEDSVIWFLAIFHQRVIQIHFLEGRSFHRQTSSFSPRFPSPSSQGCAAAPVAFRRGGLIPAAVRGEGCASVPMETIWRVFQLV